MIACMYVMCVYIYYNIFLFVVCDSLSTALRVFLGEKKENKTKLLLFFH